MTVKNVGIGSAALVSVIARGDLVRRGLQTRQSLVVCVSLYMLAASACGGGTGSATSPSATPVPATFSLTDQPSSSSRFLGELTAVAVVEPSARVSAGFGAVVANAGHCELTSDVNCFSAAHLSAQGVGANATAPAAPSNLIATASGGSVTLAWSAPASGDPVQSYVIEAGTSPGAANLASFQTGSAATTYSASGVGAGIYYLRVRAANNGGSSPPSNEAVVIVAPTGCASPPEAPGALTVVSNTGGTVVLAWFAPIGVPTSYVIEAGSAPGLANLAASDLGGPATSMTATGVAAGTYYVRIRAKNSCGVGAASNETRLVVGGPTGSGIDGNWSGTTGQGREMSLQVSGGSLLKFATGFRVGGCGVSGTSTTTFNTPRAINNNAFSFSSSGGSLSYSVTGTFSSSSVASGTIAFTYTSSFPFSCRSSESTTWTAVR